MRTLIATVVAALVLLSVTAPSAQATVRPVNEGGDTQPCGTYAEFKLVFIQMPERRAERILDTKGRGGGRRQLASIVELGGGHLLRHTSYRVYPVCPVSPGDTDEIVLGFNKSSPRHRVTSATYD